MLGGQAGIKYSIATRTAMAAAASPAPAVLVGRHRCGMANTLVKRPKKDLTPLMSLNALRHAMWASRIWTFFGSGPWAPSHVRSCASRATALHALHALPVAESATRPPTNYAANGGLETPEKTKGVSL